MTGSDFIVRQQQNEIKSLKDNLRASKHTSEQLRGLIDHLNAQNAELKIALQAACDTFQPALKDLEAENAILKARLADKDHEF